MGGKRGTVEERLQRGLERKGKCLVWTGTTVNGGYGSINVGPFTPTKV